MAAASWPAAARPKATSEERAIGLPPLPICPLDCCCVHCSHCRARWALLGSRFWALAVTEASTSTAMVVRVADVSRFMVSSRALMSNWRPIGEDAWHLPLSLEEGRWSPTGRSPGSGSLPLNSFPRPREIGRDTSELQSRGHLV